MIIEAFAKYLHTADPSLQASTVLARWLWERLSSPPESTVDSVIRAEIGIMADKTVNYKNPGLKANQSSPSYVFKGLSQSGVKLLHSLNAYAQSYEQQKWSRFVHGIKASDFKGI